MDKDDAKRLMEIQSAISALCDLFISEATQLPQSELRDAAVAGMKEVVGVNLSEVIMPVVSAHNSLNPYGENPVTATWYNNARRRVFRDMAERNE